MPISLEEFLKLPTPEVAQLVRAESPQVCVFPINGTRRWFLLEHADKAQGNWVEAYMDLSGKRHVEIFKLCFDHGLDTLIVPVFGSELFSRGNEYIQRIGVQGLERLVTHSDFLSFYKEYQVRVKFYGDYRRQLDGTSYAYLGEQFDKIAQHTKKHNRYRLFYGAFGNDATENVSEFSVRYYQQHGHAPTRRAIVEGYYGEYVDPATLFIGFDKFSVFDYPLLGLGEEDLYFTVTPSLYLNVEQLRRILYDHLYLRQANEPDYATMSKEDWSTMQNFYSQNQKNVLGVGELQSGIWYPRLEVNHYIKE